MNTHLTSRQISEWVLGDYSREAELHLRACSLCREELSRFEASLKGFRSSVRHWSESQFPPHPPLQIKRNPARSWTMGLAWAAAVIVLCILLGRLSHHPVPPSSTAVADTALLTQIDHEVSRTVPDSMESLTQLVAWDAGSSASASDQSVSGSRTQ